MRDAQAEVSARCENDARRRAQREASAMMRVITSDATRHVTMPPFIDAIFPPRHAAIRAIDMSAFDIMRHVIIMSLMFSMPVCFCLMPLFWLFSMTLLRGYATDAIIIIFVFISLFIKSGVDGAMPMLTKMMSIIMPLFAIAAVDMLRAYRAMLLRYDYYVIAAA